MLKPKEIEEWERAAMFNSRNAPLRLNIESKVAFPDGTMDAAGLVGDREQTELAQPIRDAVGDWFSLENPTAARHPAPEAEQ